MKLFLKTLCCDIRLESAVFGF